VAPYTISARWCEEVAVFAVTCIKSFVQVQMSEIVLDEYLSYQLSFFLKSHLVYGLRLIEAAVDT